MRKDLSDCGGYCHGACVHFEIGAACAPDAVYEPRKVKMIPLSLEEIKQWMVETEGKGGIGRRDMMEWLIGEVSRLTQENYDMQDKEAMALGEVTRLTSALSSSRSDAIEEAAKVVEKECEDGDFIEQITGKSIATAIRSLSSTDQGEGERE